MSILLRPLVNEKSMMLTQGGFYTFEVVKSATKAQIEKQVKEKFKVDVLDVKTVNQKGKKKLQRGRRGFYMTGGVKKAIMRLKSGQKIALFEQAVAEEETDEVTVTTAEGEEVAKVKEKKSLLGRTKVKIEKEAKKGEK